MIIECPACTTRYEIKADLPPDGRTVRCAKCETVWRAMPDSGGDVGEAGTSWVASSEQSEETSDAPAEQTTHDHFGTAGGDGDEGLWSSHQDAAAVPEETVTEGESTPMEEGVEPHLRWRAGESGSSEEDENTGKVSWFSSFRRRKNLKPTEEAEETAVKTLPQATAETIPFPRNNFAVAQQDMETKEEPGTIDAARQAVRSVFSSLGHGGPVATAAMSDDERAVTAPAKPHPHNGWAERFAGLSDHFGRAGEADGDQSLAEADGKPGVNDEGGRDLDTGEDDAWLAEKKDDASGESDPDAALRQAMRAHFLSPSNRVPVGPSLRDEELAAKLESHLKSTAATTSEAHPRPRGITGLWGKVSPAAEEEVFEPVVEESVEVKDDDTAFDRRLYREIEETREKSGTAPRRRRGGGLAVAAAWGLFLCVASGLIVGFFAFRDIIADAAPGLAPLYRILGMPVTVQPLVFESIQYEWSTSDNRPVLTVSGNVVNRANRRVKVPQFFITIKDQDSAQDREYSANLRINGSKIRSNERADFDIELVSPNPTVTAVELELRNVR